MAKQPISNDTPLTPRQQSFVEHYVATGHATKAAIAAGYSERSAAAQGSALLTVPKIRQAVDQRNAKLADELGITKQRVLEGLLHEAEKAEAAAARVRAWELLGRAHHLFVPRVDHKATAELVFKVEMGGPRVLDAESWEVGELPPAEGAA